ncbi:MAG: helix-turn-helix domain-containing protein [Candidatus Azobacteroides sp.]|nr:helix-turn-helix domain-containing protein [Candidatus Azobacteroides sp.]
MNYDKIKPELEKRGIVIKDFCRRINITEQGLHQMIRNRSMKVEVLERVSEVLAVPISYWFDDLEKDGKVFSSIHDPHIDETVPFYIKGKIQKRINSVTTELNKVLKDLAKTVQIIQNSTEKTEGENPEKKQEENQ